MTLCLISSSGDLNSFACHLHRLCECRLRSSRGAITRPQRWGHSECVRERDSYGEHGCRHGEVDGDAGDVGARDCEGEEGQGRTCKREGQESEEDWVSAGVIEGEIAFGRAGLALDMERRRGVGGADRFGVSVPRQHRL